MAIIHRSTAPYRRTFRRKSIWRTFTFATKVSAVLALIVSGTPAYADQRVAPGQQYYVNCDSGNDAAAGTRPQTAWRTLARVNTVTFQPGDSILFRNSTTCDGVLSPQGSGTVDEPIVVSSYGLGTRPKIIANGARAAVFLHNVQGWEIHRLDISNRGAADGSSRTGVYVLLENYGTGKHYVVDDVNVHDVIGCDCTGSDSDPSGGIVFKAAGSSVPTGFDGIRVSHSIVSGVDAYGIATSSQWSRRSLFPAGTGNFVPITHMHISENRLSNLGGDGIVVQNGVDSVIEHNLVDGFGLRATAAHAGLWAWNSDHPVMQFNEVSHGSSVPPTMAFDVDGGNSNVVYQYNFSHDNGGGFMLFCSVDGMTTDGATIRYNISQNDKDAPIGYAVIAIVTNACANPITNIKFYNNVIYTTVATALISNYGPSVMRFSNNIFYGQPTGSAISDPVGIFDHNLDHNINSAPSGDAHAVHADPLFTHPGIVAGYRIKCGSPALRMGVAIPDDGRRDFYGFPVRSSYSPNIGAYQGPCETG